MNSPKINMQELDEAEFDPASKLLAPLLVRISALAGVAVPLHRFAYPEKSSDGINISKLEPVNKAIELWKVRFADSQSLLVEHENISKPNLPLLWISKKMRSLTLALSEAFRTKVF